jgi:hypothetical protein
MYYYDNREEYRNSGILTKRDKNVLKDQLKKIKQGGIHEQEGTN